MKGFIEVYIISSGMDYVWEFRIYIHHTDHIFSFLKVSVLASFLCVVVHCTLDDDTDESITTQSPGNLFIQQILADKKLLADEWKELKEKRKKLKADRNRTERPIQKMMF